MESCYLQLDNSICVITSLSLHDDLVPFHGLLPAIQQALTLGFKRIYLPPVDVSFLSYAKEVELIPLPTVEALIEHLRGQSTLLFEGFLSPMITEQSVLHELPETDFPSIRGQ